ncbi:MAG: hypothetical protein FWB86_07120 [Treponema sp.]|nr:hypothetical protein [Treponema sp.]MCL2251995.1 hypothetical protein [Treponema sp.]
MPDTSLKYPVVLVHGIIAHDRESPINFWGRIPEILTNIGIKVFLGNTDAWGDCESNALILKNTIEEVLRETNNEKVNIIAHSKGGIDSRYLIWKHSFGEKIASLTTICTPHNGSEIADLIYKQKLTHTKLTKNVLTIFGKLYGDTNPNLYNMNYQLTTAEMVKFNEKVTMDNRVFYQSLYTTMNNAFDDLMFFYTYLYVKNIIGKNDGLVSEYSAKWSGNVIKIEGGISHAEILDYKKKKISGKNIPGIYLKIIEDLSKKGF